MSITTEHMTFLEENLGFRTSKTKKSSSMQEFGEFPNLSRDEILKVAGTPLVIRVKKLDDG
jgi:hypothetical protein